MLDRLFNILRANLNSSSVSGQDYKDIDAEYERYFKNERREPFTNTDFNFNNQTATPQYSPEELAHYSALELKPGAPFEEIKAAYKTLIKKYHPDRFHNEPSKHKTALDITQKLNKAYDFFERKYKK